jgi:hypothetical protein
MTYVTRYVELHDLMIVYVYAVPDVILCCIQLNEKYNEFFMSEDIEGLMAKLQEVEG